MALTDTTIQVPVAVAANICGVAVNVLAAGSLQGPVDCDAEGVTQATRADNGGGDNTRQSGLINVSATDTVVQIPIAVAANVCGVAVNVLAGPNVQFPVECTADGVAVIAATTSTKSGMRIDGTVALFVLKTNSVVQVPVSRPALSVAATS